VCSCRKDPDAGSVLDHGFLFRRVSGPSVPAAGRLAWMRSDTGGPALRINDNVAVAWPATMEW
jgi:hypothetical protein